MKKLYNFLLFAITGALLSVSGQAFGQCLDFSITAGATTVGGVEYTCDGGTPTVSWTAEPGATGYRFRIGNDFPNYSNETETILVGNGSTSTFFAAGGPGSVFNYYVSYTTDAVVNGASNWIDCGTLVEVRGAIDPVDPTVADITAGDDGVANTVCVGSTIEITADGSAGDIGQYYYEINGSGTWVPAGMSSVFEIDVTSANGFIAGANNIAVATADDFCGVNWPVANSVDVGGAPNSVTVRDISVFTSVDYDGTAGPINNGGPTVGIAEGDVFCYDGGAADVFTLNFQGSLSGIDPGGNLFLSTDSGATAYADQGAFASGATFTITGEDLDYGFVIAGGGLCANSADTFYVSTFENASVAPLNTEVSYSIDGGASVVYSGAIDACEGLTVEFSVNTDLAGVVGDNPNTQIQFEFDAANDAVYESNTTSSVGGVVTYTTPALIDGNTSLVRVNYIDNCTGTVINGGVLTINVSSAGDATGSTTVVTDESAVVLNDADDVCPGEEIDFVVDNAADLGTNGEYRVYKTVDAGASYVLIGSGVAPLNIVDHDHGLVAAVYHTVIFNDCDSIAVENIAIGVKDVSTAPTSVTTPLSTVCNGDLVTFTAVGGNLESNGIYQYSTNSGTTWTSTLNAGTDAFIDLTITGTTTVLFRVNDDCANYPAVAPFPQTTVNIHSASVAPTGADAAPAGPVCPGTDVTFTATGGTLGSNATYEYKIGAGAWTTTGNSGADAFHTITGIAASTTVDFRIKDLCDAGIEATEQSASVVVNDITTTPTFVDAIERDGIKGDAVVPAAAVICNGNDLVFNYMTGANVTADDSPEVYVKTNGVAGASTPIDGFAASTAYEFVVAGAADGTTYELFYNSTCGSEVSLSGLYTVSFKAAHSNAADLTGVDQDANIVSDAAFVCSGNGVVITLTNAGTLGDDDNYTNVAEYVFERQINGAGPWVEVYRGALNTYDVDIDDLVANDGLTSEVDVRSYIDGGCTPTGNTNVFDINLFGAQSNFTVISATHNDYCADDATTIPLIVSGSGSGITPDGFTRIVWYSIDDQGNPETKIKETTVVDMAALNAGRTIDFQNDVLLNGIVDAPDTTTTLGVRLESCDTSIFEVRTITVKDLPKNENAAGTAAVASASPSAVCAGSTSTLTLINYTLGTNGQVAWYDDSETTLLAFGPSYTTPAINADITFKVRIEADCDTTAFIPVTVTLSTIDPTDVTGYVGSPLGPVCEGSQIDVVADGSTGDGSYIWEISFNNTVFSGIDDANPGDVTLNYIPNGLTFVNGEATVWIRVSRTNGCITTNPYTESFTVYELATEFTSVTSSDAEVCVTETAVTLTANGGDAGFDGEIRWTMSKDAGAAMPVAAWDGMSSVTFDPSANGDGSYEFAVYYENQFCASNSASVTTTVDVDPEPVNMLADPIATICADESVALTTLAGLATTYEFRLNGNVITSYTGNGSATAYTETLEYTFTEGACTVTENVDIEVYGKPVISSVTNTVPAGCVAGGEVEFAVTGGNGTYNYWINANDEGSTNPVTDVAAGNNIPVYVVDGNGCESDATTVTVTSTSLVVDGTATEISCNNANDASVTIELTNGVAPYTYTYTGTGVAGTGSTSNTTFTFNNLAPEAYSFTYEDAIGCTQTYNYDFSVNEPAVIGLTVADFDEVSCFGENDGTLGDLLASGGTSPYEFSLNGAAYTSDNSGYVDLTAGAYVITVKDANDCTNEFLFNIDQPDEIVLDTNVIAYDANGFDIEVVVTDGGVGAVEYKMNSGAYSSNNVFTDLPDGTYIFTVRDANGCESSMEVLLRGNVGIEENASIFASVISYPNPFKNEVTVAGLVDGVEISVVDIYGKAIDFLAVVKDGKAVITTGNVASGVYFATFAKDGESKTIRMIKE